MTGRDVEVDEVRDSCARWLNGHGKPSPAGLLAAIPDDVKPDRYGEGGVVAELEAEVAEMLGKPAAVFVPSGTMAQQAALRVHADRRKRRTVVWHPLCHLEVHEDRGFEQLHGLVGLKVGDPTRGLNPDDLAAVTDPPAALLLELPQRDLGGVLPAWADLEAMVAWAQSVGAATHLDGARLWEAATGYGRPLAEVAELFDTVYVSFYKRIGGVSGCCLAGPADVVDEVRAWRHRHGGRLFALWPYAAPALTGLHTRLPRLAAYHEHALAIASALREVPGVTVLPDPPQTSMMHLRLAVTVDELRQRGLASAREEGVWTWATPFTSDGPDSQRIELSVGDATIAYPPAEVARLVRRLAAPAG